MIGLSPKQIALLKNPTLEGALEFWPAALGKPISPDAPLAGIHKARLVWPGATKKMVQESRAWLKEHGYGTIPGRPDEHCPQNANVRRAN